MLPAGCAIGSQPPDGAGQPGWPNKAMVQKLYKIPAIANHQRVVAALTDGLQQSRQRRLLQSAGSAQPQCPDDLRSRAAPARGAMRAMVQARKPPMELPRREKCPMPMVSSSSRTRLAWASMLKSVSL